jgi:hypothetical protein
VRALEANCAWFRQIGLPESEFVVALKTASIFMVRRKKTAETFFSVKRVRMPNPL